MKAVLSAILVLISSCAFRSEKEAPPGTAAAPVAAGARHSYQEIADRVLAPRCVGCHGTGSATRLDSYGAVKERLERVRVRALVDRDMPPPPSAALSAEEAQLLADWIASGAPEHSTEPAETDAGPPSADDSPLPPGETETLLPPGESEQTQATTVCETPGFDVIRSRVLERRCQTCHQDREGRLALAQYESVSAIGELIEEVALNPGSATPMPPPGAPQLTPEEKDLLERWFDAEMPRASKCAGDPGAEPPSSPVSGESTPKPEAGVRYRYADIRQRVIAPRCLSCHGESSDFGSLASLEDLRENLESVRTAVFVRQTMPKGDRLTLDEEIALSLWISQGAPDDEGRSASDPEPRPDPEPEPEPVEPSPKPGECANPVTVPGYARINESIVRPYCTTCHFHKKGGPAELSDLEQLRAFRKALLKRVVDPAAKAPMPPKSSAKRPDAAERELLRLWIASGMPLDESTSCEAEEEFVTVAPDPIRGECLKAIRRIGFDELKERVLVPKCLSCHSEYHSRHNDRGLGTYENVFSFRRELLERTVDPAARKPMPPEKNAEPISDADRALLKRWIDQGSPRAGGPHCEEWQNPAPAPSPEPLVSYAELDREVIKPRCKLCHRMKLLLVPVGIKLRNEADAREHALGIWRESILNCAMPKRPFADNKKLSCENNKHQLSREEKALLERWLGQEGYLPGAK